MFYFQDNVGTNSKNPNLLLHSNRRTTQGHKPRLHPTKSRHTAPQRKPTLQQRRNSSPRVLRHQQTRKHTRQHSQLLGHSSQNLRPYGPLHQTADKCHKENDGPPHHQRTPHTAQLRVPTAAEKNYTQQCIDKDQKSHGVHTVHAERSQDVPWHQQSGHKILISTSQAQLTNPNTRTPTGQKDTMKKPKMYMDIENLLSLMKFYKTNDKIQILKEATHTNNTKHLDQMTTLIRGNNRTMIYRKSKEEYEFSTALTSPSNYYRVFMRDIDDSRQKTMNRDDTTDFMI